MRGVKGALKVSFMFTVRICWFSRPMICISSVVYDRIRPSSCWHKRECQIVNFVNLFMSFFREIHKETESDAQYLYFHICKITQETNFTQEKGNYRRFFM